MARMKMLSPVDALSPAFSRTREVLGVPFRLGFFLKIALVAALTQPNFYSILISLPMQGAQAAAAGAMNHTHSGFPVTENFQGSGIGAVAGGVTLVFVVLGLLVGLAFWIGLAYLFCRLRFTLFDLVLYKHGRVRESWAKYGRQTWRYFGVTLLVGLAFLVLLAATAGPFFIHMFKSLAVLGAQGPNANPFPVIAQIFPLMGLFIIIALLGMVVDTAMQGFILPPMAIEDASIEGSFGRFFALLRDNIGPFIVFLVLQFVVMLGISMVMMFVVFLVLGVLGVGGFLVGLALYHGMWHGGAGPQAAFIAIAAAMALVMIALYLVAMVSVYGIVAVFRQAYSLYFFGPRYPTLGDQLEPPAPQPVSLWPEPILPPVPPLQPPPVW